MAVQGLFQRYASVVSEWFQEFCNVFIRFHMCFCCSPELQSDFTECSEFKPNSCRYLRANGPRVFNTKIDYH